MKYSRNQLNKAGIALITGNEEERNEAINIINDWRKSHSTPLEDIRKTLEAILYANDIEPVLHSGRLKRLTSIEYKLDLNPDMRLGGMQDIGGYRIVLADVLDLNKAFKIISETALTNFMFPDKICDYVYKPKDSGLHTKACCLACYSVFACTLKHFALYTIACLAEY